MVEKYGSLFGLFNSCQVYYVLLIYVFASKISFNVFNYIKLCESILKIYEILTSSAFITGKFLCSISQRFKFYPTLFIEL